MKTDTAGFTLIELMIVTAIVGILASIAIPNFIKFRDNARFELAISQMKLIEQEIMHYLVDNGELPEKDRICFRRKKAMFIYPYPPE